MGLHKDVGVGDVHRPYSWEYADATEREAATGFLEADIGKLARQIDLNTLWMLDTISPVKWDTVAGEGTLTTDQKDAV